MLKMTKMELELISDIDMYLFIEKGMRGSISYNVKRFMNIIINTLEENMITVLSYYLQTQIVYFMKLKQMMFMKISIKINICLILVIIKNIQIFLILLIKK